MSEGSRGGLGLAVSLPPSDRLARGKGHSSEAQRGAAGVRTPPPAYHNERSPPGPTGRPAPACCANVTRHPHGSLPQTGSTRRAGRSIDLNNIMTRLT